MRSLSHAFPGLLIFALALPLQADTQTNVNLRVMAANTSSGNNQRYETAGLNIFKGLKPDIVAIQEFNVSNSFGINTTAALSNMIATTFGTNFVYFRETGYSIPNGVISRYPILDSDSWDDVQVPDRGFAWAQIDLPGTNDLYVVSVHLHSGGGPSSRATEATNLTALIQSTFPANAWIIVAGDFNIDTSTEDALDHFKTYLSDAPIPTDAVSGGDADTNQGRNERYDYLLPSFSLTNSLTNVVFASHSFSNGLVFDSRVYVPLADVSPVQTNDSGAFQMQHMGVVKDFRITYTITNGATGPTITNQPQSLTVTQGNNATFAVGADGTSPLSYQWRFNNGNVSGATNTSYTRTNAQSGDAGSYTVVVTNSAGSVTSSVATLTVNVPASITTPPQDQTVIVGSNATFTVTAGGTSPFGYQWRFNGANISAATLSSYTRTNAQAGDAGSYTVVVTNVAGGVTSSVATLTVNVPPSISAQPQNQTINQRDNATFNVTAAGIPLNYQWRFNAGNISAATASSYTKTNAQPADIGSYSVVITNLAGSVTSETATLSLNVPQPLLAIAMPNAILWQGLSNLAYTVQAKTNLNSTNWTTLGTTSAPTINISFTNTDDGATQRYYRVVYP